MAINDYFECSHLKMLTWHQSSSILCCTRVIKRSASSLNCFSDYFRNLSVCIGPTTRKIIQLENPVSYMISLAYLRLI